MLNARPRAYGTGGKYSQLTNGKTRYFTIYPHVVTFMLKNYATDKVIAKTESDITLFAQPSNMTPPQYAKELVTKTLQREKFYE